MDDGLVAVKKEAQYERIKETVLGCYPDGMEALVTGDGVGTDMLENRILVSGDTIQSYHRPKNTATLVQEQPSVFTTFFPYRTAIGRAYYRGWLIGGFCRLRDNTSWTEGGTGHLIGLYIMYKEAVD